LTNERTNRAPTQGVETFGNISSSFCNLAIIWPPCKILRTSSQGNTFYSYTCHVRPSYLLVSFLWCFLSVIERFSLPISHVFKATSENRQRDRVVSYWCCAAPTRAEKILLEVDGRQRARVPAPHIYSWQRQCVSWV